MKENSTLQNDVLPLKAGSRRLVVLTVLLCCIATGIWIWVTMPTANKPADASISNARTKSYPAITHTKASVTAIVTTNAAVKRKTKQVKRFINTLADNSDKADTAIVTTSTVISLPTSIPVNNSSKLDSFYNRLKSPPQLFTIDNTKDTTLYGQEGTEIQVPAFAFVQDDTARNVTIMLNEYYHYSDMVAARLYTSSNGNQLITGGMLGIQAMYKETQLELRESQKIAIKMPAAKFDDSMQLFTGTQQHDSHAGTAVNWIAGGQQQWNARLLPQVRVANEHDRLLRELYYWAPFHGTAWAGSVFAISPEEDREAKKKEFARAYPNTPEIKVRKIWSRRNQRHHFKDSTDMALDEAGRRHLLTKADSARYINQLKADAIYKMAIAKLESKYNFSISKMGLINCDRFYGDNRPKVSFAVDLGDGAEKYVSHLLFTRIQSVMPCYAKGHIVYFPNVPVGEPVQFVSIGVRNNAIVSCLQSLVISKKGGGNMVFEEVKTGDDFKGRLKDLNQ